MNFTDINRRRNEFLSEKDEATIRAEAEERERLKAKQAELNNFQQNFLGTPRRTAEAKAEADFREYSARVESDPKNLNFWRVTFPTSVWSKDPITGRQDRELGAVDLAELRLEDISIEAYQAVHGKVVPSGLAVESLDVGFIVPEEEAKEIIRKYALDWDIQAARVRKLKATMEEEIVAALNPWKWSNGQIRIDITEKIEVALTMRTPRSAGVQALFGETKSSTDTGFIPDSIDDLVSMAIRYDTGQDRALAYALAIRLKDNPSFKPRLFLLQRELKDENLANLYSFSVLYGNWATDRRTFSKLAPIHIPGWLRRQAAHEILVQSQLAELTK